MYEFWFISINLHEIYQRTRAHTPPGPDRIPARIQISSSAATATTRVQRTLFATGALATTRMLTTTFFFYYLFYSFLFCSRSVVYTTTTRPLLRLRSLSVLFIVVYDGHCWFIYTVKVQPRPSTSYICMREHSRMYRYVCYNRSNQRYIFILYTHTLIRRVIYVYMCRSYVDIYRKHYKLVFNRLQPASQPTQLVCMLFSLHHTLERFREPFTCTIYICYIYNVVIYIHTYILSQDTTKLNMPNKLCG